MLVATHNGTFHADEVTASVIFYLLDPETRFIRTRDPETMEKADYVVDVSGQFDLEKHFDHHPREFGVFRDNGIKYATAGLIWRKFGLPLLKKLAGELLIMAQSGQYNYLRCLKHGENGAAQLAAIEFAKSTMHTVFLLNRVYEPYYKWSFRAMRELPVLSLEAELLEYLITTDNEEEMAEAKYDVIDVLIEQGLTKAICGDLEKHAYSVNDQIQDPEIRNLHILAGI